MKRMIKTLLLAAGALVAPLASASVISWNFDASLQWVTAGPGAPVFGAGGGSQNVSSTSLNWGDPSGNHLVVGGGRSGIDITNGNILGGTVFTNGPVALTNTITHYNNPISGSYATLNTATLLGTLLLTPANPAGPALPAIVAPFGISFKETSNSTPCGFPSTSVCDDIFVMTFGALNNMFVYDGETYYLSIVETTGGLNPLSNASCALAGAANGCLGFQTREGQFTPAQFAIMVTHRPVGVPAPGALLLMSAGLLGFGFMRRKAA